MHAAVRVLIFGLCLSCSKDHSGEIEHNEFFDVVQMWQATDECPFQCLGGDADKCAAAAI